MPRRFGSYLPFCLIALAAGAFCVDRLMDRSYPLGPPIGAAADLDGYFHPSVVYLKWLLQQRELPLWNPYQMAGEPFLAVHQPGVTYPLLVALLWLPANLVLAVHAVLHVFLAGAFTFLYARRIGADASGALTAAFAYTFSFVVIGAVFNTAYLSAYVWLPVLLHGVHETVVRRSRAGTVVLACAMALGFAAGYAQGFFYSLLLAGLYAVVLLAAARRRLHAVARLALASALALAVSSLQLAATIELASRATRSLHGLSIADAGLGVTSAELLRGLWSHASSSTVTAFMIPLGALGLWSRPTRRHAAFFAVSAALAADFTRGAAGYVYPLFFELPAGNVFRLPLRMGFVYAFCAAMLAGIGQTALLGMLRGHARLRFALAAILPLVAGYEIYTRSELPIRFSPLAGADTSLAFAELTEPARERGQYERIFLERDLVSPVPVKLGQLTGAFVVPDYEPAMPNAYRDFFGLPADRIWHGWMWVSPTVAEKLGAHAAPLRRLDLLGVRFYADARWSPTLRERPLSSDVSGRLLSRPLRLPVAEREQSLPRAYVVHDAIAVASAEEALRELDRTGFDPRRSAVVVAPAAGAVPSLVAPQSPASEYARILEYRPNDVIVEARCAARCLVVLTDLYYPGWTVSVGGEPGEILQTNHLVRGVVVEAGSHRIVYSYRPLHLMIAAGISGVSLLVLCGLGVTAVATERRGPRWS